MQNVPCENQQSYYEEDEIDLRELFATIWRHKVFIFLFTFVITSLVVVYLLYKPNSYKIYTVLAPQEEQKGINLGGLGALASMAGVNIGGSSGVTPKVAFKTLIDNYAFMKNFIKENNIDKMFLNKDIDKDYIFALNYDGIYKLLHSDKKDEKINFFKDIYKPIKKDMDISDDKKTGLITISVTHPSRKFAYYLLNAFLKDGTNYLIDKNLKDIDLQIKRYKAELKKTNNLELKAELAKLISNLIKQKVYINSSKYYKVRVVTDPYIPDPKDKAKPKRALIVIVAFITSIILSIFIIFFMEFLKSSKEEESEN